MKENPAAHFKLKPLIFALTRWRMWLHVIYCICGIASNMAVNTYNPQIIRSFGFAQAEANAMSSVGPWLQIPLTLGAGYALSRSPRKGAIMIGITAVMLVLNGVYFGFVRNSTGGIWARYVVMQLIVGFGQPFCKSKRSDWKANQTLEDWLGLPFPPAHHRNDPCTRLCISWPRTAVSPSAGKCFAGRMHLCEYILPNVLIPVTLPASPRPCRCTAYVLYWRSASRQSICGQTSTTGRMREKK